MEKSAQYQSYREKPIETHLMDTVLGRGRIWRTAQFMTDKFWFYEDPIPVLGHRRGNDTSNVLVKISQAGSLDSSLEYEKFSVPLQHRLDLAISGTKVVNRLPSPHPSDCWNDWTDSEYTPLMYKPFWSNQTIPLENATYSDRVKRAYQLPIFSINRN